ncbi:MAG: hypothetical protein OCC49_10820 [Fibrobacterales bacterium]
MQATVFVILSLCISGLFAQTTLYFEDFENISSASSDWSIYSGSDWEIGAPTYSSGPEALWGDNVAGLDLESYPSAYSYNYFTSSTITLPLSSDLQLEFHYWSDISNYNELQVEIYTGTTWYPIITNLLSNTSNQWRRASYDLASYAGQNIKLRFIAALSYSSSYYSGAYIDNIILTDFEGHTLYNGSTVSGTMQPSTTLINVTTTSINATSPQAHSFSHWTSKQNAIFGDATQAATTVTLTTNDTIAPVFVLAPMKALSETPDTLNLDTNALDSNWVKGVWTSFTAPKAGIYRFDYNYLTNTTLYSVAMHPNSPLSVPRFSYSSRTSGSNSFTADSAGHTFYFHTTAYSASYNLYSIELSVKHEVTLTTAATGSGTPTYAYIDLSAGDSATVTATPHLGWTFVHWSVDTAKKATIRTPDESSTIVIVDSSTTITATFTRRPVAGTLISSDETYNYSDDGTPQEGVFFQYSPPSTNTYVITRKVNSSIPDSLIVYSDSLYTTPISKTYCSCTNLFSSELALEKDSIYYIRIYPNTASLPDYDFTISADTSVTVAIAPTTHGEAYVFTSGGHTSTASISDDDAVSIDATPQLSYLFSAWTSSKPTATDFDDATLASTTFSTTEDVIITPQFSYAPPHLFNTLDSTFSLEDDSFLQLSQLGILIKHSTADSGFFILSVEDMTTAALFSFSQTTDSSFSTELLKTSGSLKNSLPLYSHGPQDSAFYKVYNSGSTTTDSITIITEKAVGIKTLVTGSPAHGTIEYPTTLLSLTGALSDTIITAPDTEIILTANPNPGYIFSQWSTLETSPSTFDSVGKTLTLAADSTLSITAHFQRTPPHLIDDTLRSYEYTSDASDQNWQDGSYFVYRAPAIGSYNIVFNNYGLSSYKILHSYTDSTFSTPLTASTTATDYPLTKTITATSVGQTFYYKVLTTSVNATRRFSAQAFKQLTVELIADSTGTTKALYGNYTQGDTVTLKAIPKKGHSFKKWIIATGNPIIADSTDPNTDIYLRDQHVLLRATFKLDSINTAHESPIEYDYYTDSQNNLYSQEGVWFKYHVTIPGSQLISIISENNTDNRLVFYGLDSTFSEADSIEVENTGSFYHAFTGIKGETHYFRLTTDVSSRFDSFSLKAHKSATITTATIGAGSLQFKSTSDSDGAYKPENVFFITTPIGFVAAPETGYQFSHWEVTGLGSVGNIYASETTIIPITDMTVTAHFRETDKYTITTTPLLYNYTNHAAGGDPRNGVWFTFTAPNTAEYTITIDDPSDDMESDKIFYQYSDSTFTTYLNKETGPNHEYHTINAIAGETYYFMATVKKAEEYDKDFIIFVKGRYTAFTIYSTSFEVEYSPIGASKPLNATATGSWERGPASLTAGPDDTYNGAQLIGTNINGFYGNNAQDSLRIDSIILPDFDDIELSFASWCENEKDRDIGTLLVKGSHESEWKKLLSANSPNPKWNRLSKGLDDYAGDTISLLFIFESDDILTFDGWYIDDITITLMMDETIGPGNVSSIDPATIPIIPGGPNDTTLTSGEPGTENPGEGETSTGPITIPPRDSGGYLPDSIYGGEWITNPGTGDTIAYIDTTRGDTLTLQGDLVSPKDIQDSVFVLDSIAPILPSSSSRFSSLSIIPQGTTQIGVPIHARLITIYSIDGSKVFQSTLNGTQESIFEIPQSIWTGSILFMEIEE